MKLLNMKLPSIVSNDSRASFSSRLRFLNVFYDPRIIWEQRIAALRVIVVDRGDLGLDVLKLGNAMVEGLVVRLNVGVVASLLQTRRMEQKTSKWMPSFMTWSGQEAG
ncbi:hypothetical protein Tco_0750103 [Tanacetum coccineum]|uniref:Uncharacterized protein n=1 Tax=Tanacetum coccineum TaxID=301880 RepID=A0ABQ4Z3F2_9ASTR